LLPARRQAEGGTNRLRAGEARSRKLADFADAVANAIADASDQLGA
jgi:hypothetical protein